MKPKGGATSSRVHPALVWRDVHFSRDGRSAPKGRDRGNFVCLADAVDFGCFVVEVVGVRRGTPAPVCGSPLSNEGREALPLIRAPGLKKDFGKTRVQLPSRQRAFVSSVPSVTAYFVSSQAK